MGNTLVNHAASTGQPWGPPLQWIAQSMSPLNRLKAFTYIHIKTQGFPFTMCITFANNIINHFIKRNKDQNTLNNIYFIVFEAMHNIYIGYHQSYSIMCLTTQDSLTSLNSKMRLRSLQGLAFTRGLSAYKCKTTKIRKHKEKIRKTEKNTKFGHQSNWMPKTQNSGLPFLWRYHDSMRIETLTSKNSKR